MCKQGVHVSSFHWSTFLTTYASSQVGRFLQTHLDSIESDSSPQSLKLLNSNIISFREGDPILWTIISDNMESPNNSFLVVLMCFLESESILPASRYCLVYLCTAELFIRHLSHFTYWSHSCYLNHLISVILGQKFWPYMFILKTYKHIQKLSNFGTKNCLMTVELQIFGYQAWHVCTKLVHVLLSHVYA